MEEETKRNEVQRLKEEEQHKRKLEDIEDEDKRAPYEPEESIKRKFAQNAILEILQLCTNELAHDKRCYQSIWTLDG